MFSVSMAGSAFLAAYGRALAGTCTAQMGSYVCSGAASPTTDTTQTINFSVLAPTATTSAGFGIDTSTSGGTAIVLNGSGSFTDNNASNITGSGRAITGYTDVGPISVTTSGIVKA